MSTESTRNDIRNLLWVTRHYSSQTKGSSLGMQVFGSKKGVRDIIAGFIYNDASYYKLQKFNSDNNKQKYFTDLRATFVRLNPDVNQMAAVAILRCVQRNSFQLDELEQAKKNNTLLERCFSTGASIFGKVAKVSTAVSVVVLSYGGFFTGLRFLERSITGEDRWAEIDEVPEDEHLMSASTASFIFIKLPVLTAGTSWFCNRLLTRFSDVAVQTRLTNHLSKLILDSTNTNRNDFSQKSIQRDQRLLAFLLELNPRVVPVVPQQQEHED